MIKTRIAPSPTGIAHLGTAYISLFNYAFAKQQDGTFLVRVEDTDRKRYVEGAEKVIFEALEWLGIPHDEGPDVGGPHAPYRQSERLEIYQKYADELIKNSHAYYCFCTPEDLEKMRAEQQKKGNVPMYDGRCRHLDPADAKKRAATEPHVIRMHIPDEGKTSWIDLIRGEIAFDNTLVDDQVIIKSDGYPTYHLGVVVDDHLMEVTHILRGEEWISSTPKHLNLYKMLGWEPPVIGHMPLLRNPDKSKFSKRKNDVSILSYRDKGYLPEALCNYLCLLGWSHPRKEEIFSIPEFVKDFAIERMQKTGPIFDTNKLNWMNGLYIREKLTTDELKKRLLPYLPADFPHEKMSIILPLISDRLVTLKDVEELTSFFYRDVVHDKELLLKKIDPAALQEQLTKTLDCLKEIEHWTAADIELAIRSLQESENWKKGQYFMMIRVAVTGKTATPPLFETMEVLGRDVTTARLEQAQKVTAL
jgi:glutamyl-tRNA synthetase